MIENPPSFITRRYKTHDLDTGELQIYASVGENIKLFDGVEKSRSKAKELEDALRAAEQNAYRSAIVDVKSVLAKFTGDQ